MPTEAAADLIRLVRDLGTREPTSPRVATELRVGEHRVVQHVTISATRIESPSHNGHGQPGLGRIPVHRGAPG